MKTLSETWFADGYIDFELKKYTLLAYLQEINRNFQENKLYPQLADVIFHYNNLVAFRENKKYLQEHFPKKLTGLQMEKIQVLYEQMIQDDELMKELEDIIEYSTEHMKTAITNGTEIYEFVEDKISIHPVGIMPVHSKEGYFYYVTDQPIPPAPTVIISVFSRNTMRNTVACVQNILTAGNAVLPTRMNRSNPNCCTVSRSWHILPYML